MAAIPTQPKSGEPIKLTQTKAGWRYRVRVDVGSRPDGSRIQKGRTFHTLTEARAWVSSARTDRARGVVASPTRITFDELADAWLRSKADLKRTTVDDYRHHLKIVRARWGHRQAATLGRREVQDLISELRASGGVAGTPLGFDSVRKTQLALRLVLDFGVDIEALPKNVATKVAVPKRRIDERTTARIWTTAEMEVFRRAADDHHMAIAWRLSLCGLRRGEVLALQWRDFDLENGTVTISRRLATLTGQRRDIDTPKSPASNRVVAFEQIQPGTADLIKSSRRRQAETNLALGVQLPDWIFTDHLGRTIRTDYYSKQFVALREAAGLPAIRLHDIRHSLATVLHEAGVTPAAAAALLGHDVETHLRSYLTTSAGAPAAAAALLGGALRGSA